MKIENLESSAYDLTFSQREGKSPLPEPMQLERVSRKFRNIIWQTIDARYLLLLTD